MSYFTRVIHDSRGSGPAAAPAPSVPAIAGERGHSVPPEENNSPAPVQPRRNVHSTRPPLASQRSQTAQSLSAAETSSVEQPCSPVDAGNRLASPPRPVAAPVRAPENLVLPPSGETPEIGMPDADSERVEGAVTVTAIADAGDSPAEAATTVLADAAVESPVDPAPGKPVVSVQDAGQEESRAGPQTAQPGVVQSERNEQVEISSAVSAESAASITDSVPRPAPDSRPLVESRPLAAPETPVGIETPGRERAEPADYKPKSEQPQTALPSVHIGLVNIIVEGGQGARQSSKPDTGPDLSSRLLLRSL